MSVPILRVPPESMWPTGATPPELAASIHAQGGMTPEEMNAQRAQNGVDNYRPPPRPQVNIAELEAERQSLRLVESVSPPAFQPIPQGIAAAHKYLVPLSRSVSAEIVIHGEPNARDFKLLQKYVRLMSSADFAVATQVSPAVVTAFKRPKKHAASA